MLQPDLSSIERPLPNQLVISHREGTFNFVTLKKMQLRGSKMSRTAVAAGGLLPVNGTMWRKNVCPSV